MQDSTFVDIDNQAAWEYEAKALTQKVLLEILNLVR